MMEGNISVYLIATFLESNTMPGTSQTHNTYLWKDDGKKVGGRELINTLLGNAVSTLKKCF